MNNRSHMNTSVVRCWLLSCFTGLDSQMAVAFVRLDVVHALRLLLCTAMLPIICHSNRLVVRLRCSIPVP